MKAAPSSDDRVLSRDCAALSRWKAVPSSENVVPSREKIEILRCAQNDRGDSVNGSNGRRVRNPFPPVLPAATNGGKGFRALRRYRCQPLLPSTFACQEVFVSDKNRWGIDGLPKGCRHGSLAPCGRRGYLHAPITLPGCILTPTRGEATAVVQSC